MKLKVPCKASFSSLCKPAVQSRKSHLIMSFSSCVRCCPVRYILNSESSLNLCQMSISLISSSARLSAWSDEATEFSQSSARDGVSTRYSDKDGSLREESLPKNIPDPSSSRSSTLSRRKCSKMAIVQLAKQCTRSRHLMTTYPDEFEKIAVLRWRGIRPFRQNSSRTLREHVVGLQQSDWRPTGRG